MKLKLGVITALSVMCVSVGAAYAGEAAEPEKIKTDFTVEEAVSYANENSLELKAQNENITSLKYKYDADKLTRRNLEKAGYAYGTSDFDYYLYGSGFNEFSDLKQYDIAERSLDFSKYKLDMQVEGKFYSCINADRKIAVAQEAVDNARENARIAAEKKDAGFIGAIEAESFDLAVINSENELDKAKGDRDYAYAEFKELIAYPADQPITLKGTFTRQPMNSTPPDEALAELDNTANKKNLDDGWAIQAELLNTYKKYYGSNNPKYAYQSQIYAYAKEEADYKNNVGQLRLGIISAYNTMKDTYNQLDYIDGAIALKERQADAQKTSYELGLSTASEYIAAVAELDSLRLQSVDAEIGAYLASKAYELSFYAG